MRMKALYLASFISDVVKPYIEQTNDVTPGISTSMDAGLDIGLVGPVARGASRFEKVLAPQKTYWPGGPVDLKTYWPPKKLTGPPKN